VRLAEFVDENPAKASARGMVVFARAREGEQDFASEPGSREHGRMAWQEPGQGRRQELDPHVGAAVSAVVVREPGGSPCGRLAGTIDVPRSVCTDRTPRAA